MSVPKTCHFCSPPKVKATDAKYLEHIQTKHFDRYEPFRCSICNQSFALEHKLSKHVLRKHDGETIQSEPVRSEYLDALEKLMVRCNFNIANGLETAAVVILTDAVKEITISNTRSDGETSEPEIATQTQENQTSEKVRKPPALPSILRTPPPVQGLICLFCDSKFPKLAQLREHQDTNHNEVSNGPNKCAQCEKRYHYGKNLLSHQDNSHNLVSEGSHRCDKCKRRFHFRSSLLAHQRKDHASTEFKLKACRKLFEHRPAEQPGTSGTKPHKKLGDKSRAIKRPNANCFAYCNKCNKLLKKTSVEGHLASSKHIGFHCLRCKLCGYSTFWDKGNMVKHIKQNHPGREIGFVDNKHVIKEEIEKLMRECIVFLK